MFELKKRFFILERIAHALIYTRVLFTHLLPLELYLILLLALLIAKFLREGFTPYSTLLLPILALQLIGELNSFSVLQYSACLLMVGLEIISAKMYWLPASIKPVGVREDSLQGGLHYFEFFPLDTRFPIKISKVKWHHGKQIHKMLEYLGLKNRTIIRLAKIMVSYIELHHIEIGAGQQFEVDQSIVFCHGKGGTPFMYSSILMHLAGEGFKVGAAQHNEVAITGLTEREEIKSFREKEVETRASQLLQSIIKADKPNTKRIVLIGHSYGCATLIQAYHNLPQALKKKISHIILMDPWFFPLTDRIFSLKFDCPLLVLANQDFLKNPDVLNRNKLFFEKHEAQYVIWKNAHHLHQSDMGFINGNLLGAVKNSHLSHLMLELNTQAIDKFINGERVEGAFGQNDLGRSYEPDKMHIQNVRVF